MSFRLKHFLRAITFGALLVTAGCTGITVDPGAGAETVMVPTLRHRNSIEVEYLRKPSEGPLVWKGQAWTLFWFIPLNRPDMGLWLREAIPPDAEAANVRATVRTPAHGHLLYFVTIGLVRFQNVEFRADPVRFVPPPRPVYDEAPLLPGPGLGRRDSDTTPAITLRKSL